MKINFSAMDGQLMKLLTALFLFPVLASAAPKLPKIRVCYSPYREELVTADLLVARDKGFFQEENLDVEFIANDSEKPVDWENSLVNFDKRYLYPKLTWVDLHNVRKTSKGKCDFTSTALENLYLAKVDPQSIQTLAMYLYGQNYDTHLLVRAGSTAVSVKDLKGKTIRIGQIGTRLVLEHILKAHGMTLDDVQLANVSPDELLPGLQSGKFEASIAYNPTTPLLLASNTAKILEKNIYSKYMSPFVPHSTLIASASFKESQPVAFKKFMGAFRKAATYVQKNPTVIVEMLTSRKDKVALTFNYVAYSPATVQKSAAFFNISEPYFIGEPAAPFTVADVRASVFKFHEELLAAGFLIAAVSPQALDASLQMNSR
jgi:ABC-type nitrate/sulfonate/bicarbonate transport system substrate-binding protein